MNIKESYINIFRENGFNCFPLVRYREGETNTKRSDTRWQARRTVPNQLIKDAENYGVVGTVEGKSGTLDLDDKERYRKFAERLIAENKMVIETGNGWHIPIKNFSTIPTKVELFDYAFMTKKIIEFQGVDHYVIGAGSTIWHEKLQREITYTNVGSENIWDVRGKDFNAWIDMICNELNLTGKKKTSNSSYKNLRDKFSRGEIPTDGQSNDYFHQAAIQCMTDGLTLDEALTKIENIWKEWRDSKYYSDRPWSSVRSKIEYSYENDTPLKQGRPEGGGGKIDRTGIAKTIIADRKIYSDIELSLVYENKLGFLENITKSLQREVQTLYPELAEADYKDIIFKLKGMAQPIPETNKDLIVFKNGIYSNIERKIITSDDIADLGFPNYNYLPCHDEFHPTEFLKIVFNDIPKDQHKIVNAGLKSIIKSRHDPKISVIHGASAVGKSTTLNILGLVLGNEYAFSTTVSDFITDRATRSNIRNKRLLVFQDMPEQFKDFAIIKSIAGEINQTIRGFNQANTPFPNKLKIWGSCNYLPEIPEKERNAMFTQRLSLITNVRVVPHDPNDSLAEDVAESEGEKIISWLVNLDDKDCQYEGRDDLSKRWVSIQSPEIAWLNEFYEIKEDKSEVPVSRLLIAYRKKTGLKISMEQMVKTLEKESYAIKNNIILNIKDKPQLNEDKDQRKFRNDDD
jgi:hypothetical protein